MTNISNGTGGLIPSLNQRLFTIRRVANQVPNKQLKKLACSLWMSKLRYGLQLCTEVRLKETDPSHKNVESTQVAQNKLLRLLDNTSLKERVPTKTLLDTHGFLSVNQLAANIKLTETWKATNDNQYPIQLIQNKKEDQTRHESLRPSTVRTWKENHKTAINKESFVFDAAKIWNQAPLTIKNCNTLNAAKKAIHTYCKTLPI